MPDFAATPTCRAAIYARVSSEEQREGQTIDSQIAELERFTSEKGWVIAGVYKDEGWSGALLSRPALDRLRDDAARKQFDLVLLNDVDRLARDVAHLGIVKRDLERCGVRVVFRKLPSDESPTYNLMVNVLGSFAEFEREMIADRTRRGRRHKVEVRQKFLGAIASYGYRYVPKDRASGQDGYLAVVAEEAALVRQMYEWVDGEGLSAHQVVARLNQAQARARKGGKWAKSTVLRILRNETYAGVWHYNKHYSSEPLKSGARSRYRRTLKNSNRLRPRGEWLPVILPAELRIVPRELWQRVQQQLTKNVTFSPRNSKHSYRLKGLVKCGGCGAAYVGDPSHGKFYYRCLNRCKRVPMVKEEYLDETVWSAVAEAILNPAIILDQVGKFHEREAEDERISSSEAQTVGRALVQVRREEARLLEAYRIGIVSPTQLGQELELLKKRQNALEVREGNLRRQTGVPGGNKLRRTMEGYCQRVAEQIKTFNEAERQRFLRLLVDNVIFEGAKVRIRGVIPLDDNKQATGLDERQVSQIGQAGTSLYTTKPYARNLNSVIAPYRIADTAIYHGGRNPARVEDTAMYHHGRNSDHGNHIRFTLIKSVIKLPQTLVSRNHLGQFVGQVSKAA
jgi:site-specific DNA recombinase